MNYSITRVSGDLLSRMGENGSSPSPSGSALSLMETMEERVRVLLPEIGRRLLLEAPAGIPASGEHYPTSLTFRKMPCGLYCAEAGLPEDFVGLESVKMSGWERSAHEVIGPEESRHGCQWSAEEGIAGSPEKPRVYFCQRPSGGILTLMGSEGTSDTLDHLIIRRAPTIDSEGGFRFPEALYSALIAGLQAALFS